MRVVAMSLQMEIRVFIQEDHPSDGTSLPSTSTYLQCKSSWCPSLNSQALSMSIYHIWSLTHIFSHREFVWSQGSMPIISVPWPPLSLHLSEGRQLRNVRNQIFSHVGSFITCSPSDSSAFSVIASYEHTLQNHISRENSSSKYPNTSPLDNEIKER